MTARSYNILIAALGGEGGGVLADWIIAAGTLGGYPIQSTSIPGVAQRTGATTYYLELFPQKIADLGGAQPILALTPMPGDIDVVIASELVEAGRAMQNGFVTPSRTTLIASTSRVYAIGERAAMADGRFDSDRIVDAARELSHRLVLLDGNALTQSSGHPINAIMFGALIASGALPFSRADAEAAIRDAGKATESNLRGFATGFDSAGRVAAVAVVPVEPVTQPELALTDVPEAAREIIVRGIERLIDYQGEWYARRYLDRIYPIIQIERNAGSTDFVLTQEAARYLALWMSYEDVIRVADLKTRAERRGRIRDEVRAKNTDIVRVADYLKPGLDEMCSVMPRALGQRLYEFAERRGWQHRLNVGMHIRSSSVTGFLLLRLLGGLRWWRPYSWRYQQERARIETWLAAITRAARIDLAVAIAIAECGQIMKGYGDTHARAVHNFDLIAGAYFNNPSASPAMLAAAIAAARKASLADPDGQSLLNELAQSPVIPTQNSHALSAAAE